ncbi:hypothetical protein EGR_10339 [Echinococcus granulosus]|uniref:Uncharacterized protein n=1 Tax=Echinococcus granulosus TaxID=6210 RepID=W6U124_ECHGR|nr:hypothetical protein EGR_10339 [Echinococcus granulosus]EUB54810.1 hypothetical protein EGR_10339 [Echinococcus granulosus]
MKPSLSAYPDSTAVLLAAINHRRSMPHTVVLLRHQDDRLDLRAYIFVPDATQEGRQPDPAACVDRLAI